MEKIKWQVDFIDKYAAELVDLTFCTEKLMHRLKGAKLLSEGEYQNVMAEKTHITQATRLYKTLKSKVNAIPILKQSLLEERQTGAWAILNKAAYGILSNGKSSTVEIYNRLVFIDDFTDNVDDAYYKQSMKELEILKRIDGSKHVLRSFGWDADTYPGMVRSLFEVSKCSLKQLLDEDGQKSIGRVEILRQITHGMKYLHDRGIIHRNLSPTNIRISEGNGNGYTVKIANLRVCKEADKGSLETIVSSDYKTDGGWQSPEILESKDKFVNYRNNPGYSYKLTKSSDIFSMGALFYWVLTDGRNLFQDCVRQDRNILDGIITFEMERIKEGLNGCPHLIQWMTHSVPDHRPTCGDILSHNFFWSSEQSLNFIHDVCDYFRDTEKYPKIEPKGANLEDLFDNLTPEMTNILQDFSLGVYTRFKAWRWNICKVQRLLHAVNYTYTKTAKLSKSAKQKLGGDVIDTSMICKYWFTKFPCLISLVCYRGEEIIKSKLLKAVYIDRQSVDKANKCTVVLTPKTCIMKCQQIEDANPTGTGIGQDEKMAGNVSDAVEVMKQRSSTNNNTEKWLDFDNISIDTTSLLNTGQEYTKVYRGKFWEKGHDTSPEYVEAAIKVVTLEPNSKVREYKEIEMLEKLSKSRNENIIEYFGSLLVTSEACYMVALELCHMNLQEWVNEYSPPVEENKKIVAQIRKGLEYVHSKNIIHFDIKPSNILLKLVEGQKILAKIADFELAEEVDATSKTVKIDDIKGTEGWIAPEILTGLLPGRHFKPVQVSFPVDIFALGCVSVFVLSNGRHPFGRPSQREANILEGKLDINDACFDMIRSDNTILDMLKMKPAERSLAD